MVADRGRGKLISFLVCLFFLTGRQSCETVLGDLSIKSIVVVKSQWLL